MSTADGVSALSSVCRLDLSACDLAERTQGPERAVCSSLKEFIPVNLLDSFPFAGHRSSSTFDPQVTSHELLLSVSSVSVPVSQEAVLQLAIKYKHLDCGRSSGGVGLLLGEPPLYFPRSEIKLQQKEPKKKKKKSRSMTPDLRGLVKCCHLLAGDVWTIRVRCGGQ